GGRPGDGNGARPERCDRRFPMPIATSFVQVLRRPLESAQYACGAYSELLHLHGIQASMSRVGNPYDNAKAESFMKTLKQEEVQGLAYKDADDARRRIGAFIDTDYNTQRLHSALHYLTPEEYEQKHSGGRQMEKAA
ncbi:integrase core domain-containing protein, partial [Mesorhizobium sp. VK22B]